MHTQFICRYSVFINKFRTVMVRLYSFMFNDMRHDYKEKQEREQQHYTHMLGLLNIMVLRQIHLHFVNTIMH